MQEISKNISVYTDYEFIELDNRFRAAFKTAAEMLPTFDFENRGLTAEQKNELIYKLSQPHANVLLGKVSVFIDKLFSMPV